MDAALLEAPAVSSAEALAIRDGLARLEKQRWLGVQFLLMGAFFLVVNAASFGTATQLFGSRWPVPVGGVLSVLMVGLILTPGLAVIGLVLVGVGVWRLRRFCRFWQVEHMVNLPPFVPGERIGAWMVTEATDDHLSLVKRELPGWLTPIARWATGACVLMPICAAIKSAIQNPLSNAWVQMLLFGLIPAGLFSYFLVAQSVTITGGVAHVRRSWAYFLPTFSRSLTVSRVSADRRGASLVFREQARALRISELPEGPFVSWVCRRLSAEVSIREHRTLGARVMP